MGWADFHIRKLRDGETVKFRPRGGSMSGRIESGSLVTVKPLGDHVVLKDDIVLCKVKGNQYLHWVKAVQTMAKTDGKCCERDIDRDGSCPWHPAMLEYRYQIGNNKGGINGWIGRAQIYGVLIAVEV